MAPGRRTSPKFARAHNKGASFGEWGLAKMQDGNDGDGDNPYFIEAMFNFFSVNTDVVACECYFDEPACLLGREQHLRGEPKSSDA